MKKGNVPFLIFTFISIIVTAALVVAMTSLHSAVKTEEITVIEYDGCEYISTVKPGLYGSSVGLAHKGNCKYCAQRIK